MPHAQIPMARPRKSLVVALALSIALSSLILIPRPVAAAQNRPTWTQGDFWVYSGTEGTSTSTVRMEVHEKTTLTLTLGTYEVWHVTITTTPSGGSATVQHSWVRDSDLAIAKANFTVLGSDVQVTFDPPLVQAQFPLTVNAQWSLSTTVRVVDAGFNFNLPYSATVTAEQSTTVSAGTFSVAVVRSPSTGTARDENHYSESAGNSVRQESYDGNGNHVADQELTSWRYQSGSLFFILLVVGVILAAAVAIAAIVVVRRRRRRAPPGMPPPPPPSGP
jgi:hypothetical protein